MIEIDLYVDDSIVFCFYFSFSLPVDRKSKEIWKWVEDKNQFYQLYSNFQKLNKIHSYITSLLIWMLIHHISNWHQCIHCICVQGKFIVIFPLKTKNTFFLFVAKIDSHIQFVKFPFAAGIVLQHIIDQIYSQPNVHIN